MKQLNHGVRIDAWQPEGPLAPFFDLFAGLLQDQGYSQSYRARQIRLVSDFSRWLKEEQVDVQALTSEHTDRFLLYLAQGVHLRAGDACAFQRLLQLLCQQGVVANTTI